MSPSVIPPHPILYTTATVIFPTCKQNSSLSLEDSIDSFPMAFRSRKALVAYPTILCPSVTDHRLPTQSSSLHTAWSAPSCHTLHFILKCSLMFLLSCCLTNILREQGGTLTAFNRNSSLDSSNCKIFLVVTSM